MPESFNQDGTITEIRDILLKSYLDFKKDGRYCITNRGVSDSFARIFKDATASYAENTLLCERFFFADSCTPSTRSLYDSNPEQEALYREFLDFVNNEKNREELDPASYEAKIADYQAKLLVSPPTVTEVPVTVFQGGVDTPDFIVQPLADASDDALRQVTNQIAVFIITHFSTLNFLGDASYQINLMPVNYPRYVDLIAQLIVIQ